jgi:pilus assembly protein Flp/PilA
MTSLFEQVRFMGQWLVARANIKSDKGATAVEYGLMVALIAAVIIVAVAALGTQTSDTFQCTSDSIAARTDQC